MVLVVNLENIRRILCVEGGSQDGLHISAHSM
jgi:hypothetical protein